MYQKFKDSILNINFQIEKGRYPTYSKLYKDLDALEKEVTFARRHGMLEYSEFVDLEIDITGSLLLYRLGNQNS